MRVKRQRFSNIPKTCHNCNSSKIVSDGRKFYCEKCHFVFDPINKDNMKCIFVSFDVKSEKELNKL